MRRGRKKGRKKEKYSFWWVVGWLGEWMGTEAGPKNLIIKTKIFCAKTYGGKLATPVIVY